MDLKMIKVREAKVSDLPALIDLRLKMINACPDSFLDDYGELSDWSVEDWGKWFSRLTEAKNSNLIVAEEGGKLVGIVGCKGVKHQRAAHVATLVGVGVLPEYRGQGIGGKMLKKMIAWVKNETQVERLQLTVYADNLVAIKFYQKLGFQKEGLFKNYAKSSHDGHSQDGLMMAIFISRR